MKRSQIELNDFDTTIYIFDVDWCTEKSQSDSTKPIFAQILNPFVKNSNNLRKIIMVQFLMKKASERANKSILVYFFHQDSIHYRINHLAKN